MVQPQFFYANVKQYVVKYTDELLNIYDISWY